MPLMPLFFDTNNYLQKPLIEGLSSNILDQPDFKPVRITTEWGRRRETVRSKDVSRIRRSSLDWLRRGIGPNAMCIHPLKYAWIDTNWRRRHEADQ